MTAASAQPLAGCRVLERSASVAAAWAGRLLAAMGATVLMLEPPGGSPLRRASPLLDGDGGGGNGSDHSGSDRNGSDRSGGDSALFAYVAAGKRSRVADLATEAGRAVLVCELDRTDILIDDTPVIRRAALGLAPDVLRARHPGLVHVSVLPFGAIGAKAGWDGEEVNLLHAGGEGYLLPNGLSNERFPDRAPLKIYGHFAGYQAGAMAALSALSAWWAAPEAGGQFVDVSVQDAVLSVGAFALQRLGDGSLEHRTSRRFRYGGVFEARDGFIELLTLEDRQWQSLVTLLEYPDWATDPALADPLERSRRGDAINAHIGAWMRRHDVDDIVRRAQELGVPAAKYRTPADVVAGDHERARGLFRPLRLLDGRDASLLVAPFHFRCSPLDPVAVVPALDQAGQESVG